MLFKGGDALFRVVGALRLADQDVADVVFVQDALDNGRGDGGIKASHVRLPAVDLRLRDADAALLALVPGPADDHREAGVHGGAGLDAVVGGVTRCGRQAGFGDDGQSLGVLPQPKERVKLMAQCDFRIVQIHVGSVCHVGRAVQRQGNVRIDAVGEPGLRAEGGID